MHYLLHLHILVDSAALKAGLAGLEQINMVIVFNTTICIATVDVLHQKKLKRKMHASIHENM